MISQKLHFTLFIISIILILPAWVLQAIFFLLEFWLKIVIQVDTRDFTAVLIMVLQNISIGVLYWNIYRQRKINHIIFICGLTCFFTGMIFSVYGMAWEKLLLMLGTAGMLFALQRNYNEKRDEIKGRAV